MLYDNNPRQIQILLEEADPKPYLPCLDDRDAWQTLAAKAGPAAKDVLAKADQAVAEGFDVLELSTYLRFFRDGDRKAYETPLRTRRRQLCDLILAEAFDPADRMDPILDRIWAILEETTWCMPAHEQGIPDPAKPEIDLAVAVDSLALAEADMILGERLAPVVRRRIRDEIEKRVLTPYLTSNWHWLYRPEGVRSFNWTAVCNGGVVGAACHLVEDTWQLAEMIARAGRSNDRYLDGFYEDGGTSEGLGYWGFGFGYFCILADLVSHYTGGRLDWFEDPRVGRISRFPLRTAMGSGRWPTFSDCPPDVKPMTWHVSMLAEHLDDPDMLDFYSQAASSCRATFSFPYRIREVRFAPEPEKVAGRSWQPAPCDFLPDLQWMVSRVDPGDPDALSAAIKGGHNGEMHNQNDVGSFIVQLGGEQILADPGSGLYTRQYFRAGQTIFTKQSVAHSVPVVKAEAQAWGEKFAAKVLEHQSTQASDLLVLDMTAVYPETDLESLTRSWTVHRSPRPGKIELLDAFSFAYGPEAFASVLVSLIEPEVTQTEAIYTGQGGRLRLQWSGDLQADLNTREDVAYSFGTVTLYRLRLIHPKARSGEVRVTMEPI